MSTPLDDVLRVLLAGVEDGQYVIRQGAQFGGTDTIGASSWYDGTGAPSSGLGTDGDYYLDDSTGDVYSKTSGSWNIVANITGATGATGPAGPAGPSNVITESSGPTNLAVGAIADGQFGKRTGATFVGATLAAVATSGAAADVSGLATVATSGSAGDLGTGTLPLGRLSNITDTQVAAANKDGLAAVASLRTLGTGASQAAAGTAPGAALTAAEVYADAAVATHVAAVDPHGDRAFATAADVTVAATGASALAAHVVASDPHGDRAFATAADVTVAATAASALATHVAAPDPHVVYQLRSEKNAASGYVGLSSAKRVVMSENVFAAGEATLRLLGGAHIDGLKVDVDVTATNYTLIASDGTPNFALYCTATLTVTLPTAANASETGLFNVGQLYSINNVGTGTVNISVPAGDPAAPTFTGGATTFSVLAGNSALIQYDPTSSLWRIIANTNRWFTATDKLLGRSTAGAGYGEEIALTSVARTLIAQTTQANMRTTGLGLATVASSGSASDLGTGTLPAGRMPALTGDVMTSAGSVATLIGAGVVTLANQANLAANSIQGNTAGFPATPQALTVAQVRTLLGLATVATSGSAADLTGTLAAAQMPALTGDVTTSAGAVATTIAAGAVTLAKQANLAANSIQGNNTGSPATPIALTTAQAKALLAIAAGDVSGLATVATSGSASDLGTGTLPLARLSGITSSQLSGTAGITGGQIASLAIADANVANSAAIQLAKLETVADQTVLGNNNGSAATANPLTMGTLRSMLGLATVATSGSASDLGAGTLPLARLSSITDTQIAAANKDGTAGTASMRTLGTGAATACAGNDSRLSDSRTANAINLGTATVTGALPAANMPALTGDITTSAGAVATSLSAARVNQLLAGLDIDARVFSSRLTTHNTPFLLVSAVAYFVYMGRTTVAITPKFVEFYVSTLGAGTSEVGEVGLFSTPSAPNKAAQSLTKLVSTGTVDTVKVGLGVKRNTSAFATSVAAGTHLWAGIRYAMSGTPTQPTTISLGYDFAEGRILSLASAGALTGTGPFAGAIIAASATQVCPDLRVTMD